MISSFQAPGNLSVGEAVAIGLQRSARLITAAAFVLAVNFASFLVSGVSGIKMIGIGIAFAIMLDATVIRGLLVPSLMKLMGDWNWWADRKKTDALSVWHNAKGKYSMNVLWGDGHTEFFQFPNEAYNWNYTGPAPDPSFKWW